MYPNACSICGSSAQQLSAYFATSLGGIIRAIKRGRLTDKTRVGIIFANVDYDDILLKEDLDNIARDDPLFKGHYVLKNPPTAWEGCPGLVAVDIIKAKLLVPPPSPGMKLLICGPPPMVSAMEQATEKARTVSKLEDQVFCF